MSLTRDILTYLTSAPTSNFVAQPVTVIDQWQGDENLLWRVESRGREAVLKLFLDAGQARSRRQFDGQQLFAPLGLAPLPLWYDRYPAGLSRQILVYTWAPGSAAQSTDAQQVADHARSAARVHTSDVDQVRRFSPRPLNLKTFWTIQHATFAKLQQRPAVAGIEGLSAQLDQLFHTADTQVQAAPGRWQESMPSPIHGDLRWGNCTAHAGHIVLLDWEMFGLGDPSLEVATFLHSARTEMGAEQVQLWREHYLEASEDPELGERIDLYERLLTVRDLGFLLDGLHQVEAADAVDADDLAMVHAVTSAAAQLAADTFKLDPDGLNAGVTALFGQWSRPD